MRAIIVVMDSLGVGEMPDAAIYEDAGTDTLGHILDNYPLDIPNLRKLTTDKMTKIRAGAKNPVRAHFCHFVTL